MKKQIQATTKIDKKGKLTAIASTEDKDRSGDVLSVHNWDFSKFLMNPVLQAGHDYRPQFTIGRAKNIRVEGKQVLFEPEFHTITPLAKQVKEMYEKGFLKAWSVGFIPGTKQLSGEEEGTDNELLEVSAVAVPANAFATMKGFEDTDDFEGELKSWINHEEKIEENEENEESEEETKGVTTEKELVIKKTGESEDHVHMASFDDESGNGSTDAVDGHVHPIKDFLLEESDGHTHTLSVNENAETASAHGKKKPNKKKENVERWNQSLPAIFNKEFNVEEVNAPFVTFENDVYTKFFECEIKDIFVNNYSIPSPLVGTYLTAFKTILEDYELIDTRNWHRDLEFPPQYEVIQLNSTKKDDFLVEGIQFYKVHSQNGVVIKFSPGWGGLNVSIITSNAKKEWNNNLIDKIHTWSRENNFLKGEKFALSGEFIPKSDKSWDDVVLDKDKQDVVQKATRAVEGGMVRSRGLLFIGPPGTGKTLTGKILMNTTDSTFIWVSAKDMWRIGAIGAIKMAFQLARDLGNTILFMEDIDDALKYGATDILKTELDGMHENKGLITILTSNYPEDLPDALLDRPGRFHEILNFELPSDEARQKIVENLVGELDEKTMSEIVEKTKGFSGSHIKELVDYAKIVAEDDGLEMKEALIKSLEKLIEQRELVQQIRQIQKAYAIVKEGRMISAKNRKILTEAVGALEKVLHIEEKDTEEEVKGMSEFVPEAVVKIVPKKTIKAVPVVKKSITETDIMKRVLQDINRVSNTGLAEMNKVNAIK